MNTSARLRVESLEDRLAPAAGQLDPSFGTGGAVPNTLPPFSASQVSLLPDGRIFVYGQQGSGTGTSTPALERFNFDGTLDTTFGNGGVVTSPTAGANFGLLAALPDGGALLSGSLSSAPPNAFTFTRLTATGTVDPTFGTGGTTTIDFSALDVGPFAATAATIQSDGRIVVAGYGFLPLSTLDGVTIANTAMLVARLTSDGQLDTTFGTGGRTFVTFPVGRFSQTTADSIAVQPDGRIVLAGGAAVDGYTSTRGTGTGFFWATRSDPAAVRLTSDGQLDPTFGTGGRVLVTRPGATSSLRFDAARVLADGLVVLAGSQVDSLAVRLTASGQFDPTYGSGGQFARPNGLRPVAIAPDGRVVFGLTRLTPNGAPDAEFGNTASVPVTGFGVAELPQPVLVRAIAVQPDGNIVMGSSPGDNVPSSAGDSVLFRVLGSTPPSGFVPTATGTITASGAAGGAVQVLTPTGESYASTGTLTTSPGAAGTVRTATADVNGDGVADYVTGAGPGGPPRVVVIDGATGNTLADFLAFESTFTGGVYVAAGNLEGDARAEIVVTPDQGGGPRVVVYSVAAGGTVTLRTSFFGFEDANFRGGARVALGDVNRDGTPDVVVAAGFRGGPRVAVIDGRTAFRPAFEMILPGRQSVIIPGQVKLVGDFFAFPGTDATTLRNGVYVAAGDVDGDGFADLIFGGGPDGAPRVFTLSGALLTTRGPDVAQATPVSNFFVGGNANDRGGVTVAAVPGIPRATVAVGSGHGNAGRVRVYLGADFTSAAEPTAFQDVSVFGGATMPGGVFVG